MEDLQTGWNIREITFYPEYSGYANFVNSVKWSYDANYSGASGAAVEPFHMSSNGTTDFSIGSGDYIAYNDLTKDEVLGWVWDVMGDMTKEAVEVDVSNRAIDRVNSRVTGIFPWS